jgi:hypothetical protein
MALYSSVLIKHLDSNWNSLLRDTQSWNLLRDQGFLLLQSLVNDHLQETIKFHLRVPGDCTLTAQDTSISKDTAEDPSLIDGAAALDRTLTRMKQLIQKMQKSFLNLLNLKNDAFQRIGPDLNRFCYRDCALDDWSKMF